jgi:CHAT domain-containing protein
MLQEQMTSQTPELRDKQAMQDINGARGVLRQEASLTKKLQIALSASSPNKKEIDALRQKLAEARREAVQALGELSDKYKGRYDRFVPAAVDPKYLRDISDRLPAKSLLVTYSFGDDGLYIFLASRDGKIEFRQNLNVNKAELERRIEAYRTLITRLPGKTREDWRINSWSDPQWIPLRDATTWLYQQLLAPIEDRIQGVDQIVFAPTGQMYYLPFHALGTTDTSGRQMQYLALSKKVSYVAPGSLLKAFDADHRAKSGAKRKPRILALGDVQFAPPLELLPSSKDELKAIKDIFGQEAVLLSGQQATKRGLLDALNTGTRATAADGFQFVLLSTHGILNAHEPRSSYLALEDGKKLTAQEIANLDLRGVSVVTLSACETALAGRNPGADLMSLGEYVSLAGASSVLASLWKVDDFQTAHLMREFFTYLKKDGNNKSAALQHAQIALATKAESTHPFFWSPFVLYGKGW